MAARDVDAAVRAVLELDDTLVPGRATPPSPMPASGAGPPLRRMVVRLGELARTGARDPREVVGGFVDALLAERAAARGDRRFADADRIRDALVGSRGGGARHPATAPSGRSRRRAECRRLRLGRQVAAEQAVHGTLDRPAPIV